ncbi:hypothetical protein JB92DRAFT_3311114 [Gautieria morchelliformis]|nr:hypothetical protein JB92DRAFT_3311114 [Gautieria morchelliformis]
MFRRVLGFLGLNNPTMDSKQSNSDTPGPFGRSKGPVPPVPPYPTNAFYPPIRIIGYQAAAITDGHGSQNNVPGFWNGNQHHATQPYVYAPPQFQYAPPAAGMLPMAQHAPVPVGPLVSPAPDCITQPMLPLPLAKNRLGLPPPIHHIHETIVPPVQYAKQPAVPVADQVIDYPNGDQTREYPTAEAPSKFMQTKWSWHSNGGRGGMEIRVCCGVIECAQCGRLRRSKTNSTARSQQLMQPFHGCGCITHQLHICHARTLQWKEIHHGVEWTCWSHEGLHTHPRPPMSGKLTRIEEDAVDVQIAHRSDATALELRTGNGTLGSTPLGDISPVLTDARRARYQRGQSQNRLGLASPSKGGLSFLQSFVKLKEKFDTEFLVNSGIHSPTFIVLQTPFMAEHFLTDAIADWLDSPASEEHARHGFVVDGDHSFFKSGVLLATCAWSHVLNKWAPVLYTWIDRQDIAHHRPHFKHLFGQIVQAAGSKFQAKLLLHIMDYSAAARAAHAAEYSAAMTSQLINFGFLSAEAQQVEIQRFRKEASQYLVGCETHWLGSCRRIKHSGAIVAPPLVSKFEHLTSRLLLPSITPNEFGQITDELRRVFPKAVGWLNWWLQPAVACMIFPCHRKVDNDVFAEVPHTSNPVEARHSLLHHATGINHDLIGGLERLYLHVRQLEGQYHAVKGITAGHVTPPEPRDPPKRGYHKKLDDNDGRPPDTIEALEKASKSTTYYQESGQKGNSNQPANDGTSSLPHALKSYIWSSPNSCFWDVGTELLYRAFIGLNPELKKNMFNALKPSSHLGGLFYHFQRRQDWAEDRNGHVIAGTRELALYQGILRHLIFNKWQLYDSPSDFGCAMTWMHRLISHFSIHECPHGHETRVPASKPIPQFALHTQNIQVTWHAVSQLENQSPTLSRCLQHLIPRVPQGNSLFCTELIHCRSPVNCNIMGCGTLAPITAVETSWPTVLSLMTPSGPQISETSPYQPECTVSFTGDALASSTIIDYKLVGKIIHVEEQEHWIAEICQGNMAYEYDDMHNGGSLSELGPATVLEHWREHTSLIMYRRCSTQHCTRRSIAAILKDYEQVEDRIPFLWEDTNGVLSEVHQPSQEPLTPAILPSPPVTPIQTENAPATLSPSTVYHESPPNQRCGSQGDGHDDPLDTIQCCSNCVPTLNNSDIGMYVLLRPSPEEALGKSRQGRRLTRIFYAARICSFSGSSAVLEWFAGNIYATEKARPSDFMVQRHVTEVKGALAFFPANINSTNVGQIEWPLCLWEDGYELRGYKNVGISKALIDAMPAILRILKGASPHPVMDLWADWQDPVTSKGLACEQHRSMFHTYYHVPLMAGDASIVVDACEQVTWKLNGRNLDPDHRFMLTTLSLGPGQLLLKMVVLRVYFGLRPGHDHEVWELWREGRIQRVWSDYELAMSAAQWLKWPVNEGIAMGDVRQLPKPDSPHAHALCDFLPVTVVTTDNQPHEWSLPQVGTGLTEVTFGGMETKPQVKVKRRPQPIFATRADSPQIRPKMRKLTPAPSNRVKRNEQQAGIGEEEIGPRRSKRVRH